MSYISSMDLCGFSAFGGFGGFYGFNGFYDINCSVSSMGFECPLVSMSSIGLVSSVDPVGYVVSTDLTS